MWIPVSEREPDTTGTYIVSVSTPFENDMVEAAFYNSDNGTFWADMSERNRTIGVTAWREMPPPFTGRVENDHTCELSFRETVEARLCCQRNSCGDCILKDGRCSNVDLAEAVNGWLEYILDKLDNAEKSIEDITDSEWLELL